MIGRVIFCCLTILGLGLATADQALPQVAVIPFTGDNTVTSDQLSFITAKFTGELIATNRFVVLDRGKMDYILQEQGFQQTGVCNTSECKVQIGQMLGVENMVSGKLVRFGNSYAMHLDFIDVGTGQIAKTADVEEKGDLEDVYKPLCYNGANKLVQLVLPHASVPVDAIPSAATAKKLSTKRKIALAMGGASLVSSGAGLYFNSTADGYADDYRNALANQNRPAIDEAFDNTETSKNRRNGAYGIAIGTAVIESVILSV